MAVEVIVLGPERGELVAQRSHTDDAGIARALRGGPPDLVHEQVCEEEMADVVRGEVHLEAVLAELALRQSHDTRIVEDNVDGVNLALDFGGGFADGAQRSQVHCCCCYGYFREADVQVFDYLVELLLRSSCYYDASGPILGNCRDNGAPEAFGVDSGYEDLCVRKRNH
ncbi:hypothetical protein I7I50_05756 [Histoplasma capsulatum G186AR]|uniref:Uncharacterized protein n=1 Tax=Ajellomyces capsulatus TaxID=5037 RepID=A0A8H7ZAV5_AJECA|nr:hypothetical protein I7I52_04016 [Histoplasma capsulatum]QSS76339.1 hypothetical protein I7I50_05756 [Histoplasma capsulatum G186AR]